MRIISGLYKRRKLIPITGKDIRPTSDRARESVFNILGNQIFQAKVLDLFAGTGAMGIEALSRGASQVFFADSSPASCQIISKNIENCCGNQTPEPSIKILCADILSTHFFSSLAGISFDLIFLDPPYHKNIASQLIAGEKFLSCLSPDGMIIAEHSPNEKIEKCGLGLAFLRKKKYGSSMFSFFTFSNSFIQRTTHEI